MEKEEMKKTFAETLREILGIKPRESSGVVLLSEEEVQKRIHSAISALEAKFAEFMGKNKGDDDDDDDDDMDNGDGKKKKKKKDMEDDNYAESQIKRVKDANRWVPAFDKMGVTQIFSALAKSQQTISFFEGYTKKDKTAAEVFADFLCALPQVVPTKELSSHASTQVTGTLVQFTEPTRKQGAIDGNSVALAEAAQKLATDKNIPYGEALKTVRRQMTAGAASANAV